MDCRAWLGVSLQGQPVGPGREGGIQAEPPLIAQEAWVCAWDILGALLTLQHSCFLAWVGSIWSIWALKLQGYKERFLHHSS